jgi:hypothetical protein
MPLRALLLVLLVAGCGPRSGHVHPRSTSERDIGGFEVGGFRFRFVAKKVVEVRDPCEQTFFRSPPCTDAVITTEMRISLNGTAIDPAAYDPGWTPTDRFVVAERDGGPFERVDARADAMLRGLHVESCTDGRHIAYVVAGGEDAHEPYFNLLSIAHGVVLGFHGSDREGETCEAALARGDAADRRLAGELASGARHGFDVLVRAGGLAQALDFSLAHTFLIDSFHEPSPHIDDVFFEKLAESLATSEALRAHVLDVLSSRDVDFEAGRRGGGSLERWVRRIVRALPDGAREALATRVAPLCAAGESTCPPWRLHALLEGAMVQTPERRCPLATPFVDRNADFGPEAREEILLTLAEALIACEASTALAVNVLSAPGSYPARDEEFLYPPCIDAIGTGTTVTRCGSAPTLTVLVASNACDERLLHAARIAGDSSARPWQLAAIGVYKRCGREAELDALVTRLRPTAPFHTDGFQYFDRTFPPH